MDEKPTILANLKSKVQGPPSYHGLQESNLDPGYLATLLTPSAHVHHHDTRFSTSIVAFTYIYPLPTLESRYLLFRDPNCGTLFLQR